MPVVKLYSGTGTSTAPAQRGGSMVGTARQR